jgi:hypothetical protein
MRAFAQQAAAETAPAVQRPAIQRKVRLDAVNGPLEREADRVAGAVMAGKPTGAISNAPTALPQRKCAQCEQEQDIMQRKELGAGNVPSRAIDTATKAVSSGGNPLTPHQRAHFEPRFGRDLSHVRLHTDPAAATAARDINAHAYTLGNHIALTADAGRPEHLDGQLVLAHELTHVIQQGGEARALQRWSACSEATISAEDCPARDKEEVQRARAGMVFFSEMRDPELEQSGALVANFDIDKSAIKPNLARTIYWQQFLKIAEKEQTQYELVGFSDCHENGGEQLRTERAAALRQAMPAEMQSRMSVKAASEGNCMRPNTTAADRAMNRSVALVLVQYTADFSEDEDEVIVGKTPQDYLRECEAGARVKTFPFRTTRFGGAPIMAHEEGGRIVVKLPMHVKYNSDFRKETNTLPDDTFLDGAELEKTEVVRVRRYELPHWYNFNITGDASDDKTTDYCVTADKLLDFAHATQIGFYVNVAATTLDALTISTPVGELAGRALSPLTNVAKSGLQKTTLAAATTLSDVLPEVAGSRVTTSLVEGRATSAIVEKNIAEQAVTRSVSSAVGEPVAENLASSALSTAPRIGSSIAPDLLPSLGLLGGSEFGSSAIKQQWQDFLPQAEELRKTFQAQREVPDYVLNMATQGGPGPSANRLLIDHWLTQGTLEREEMEILVRAIFEEHPILTKLINVRAMGAGPERRVEMEALLTEFTEEAGVRFEVVNDGFVQFVRGAGDYGSMRAEEGAYLIERSVYEDDARLLEELTHEIPSYLGSHRVGQEWTGPVWNRNNAAEWLENTVLAGGVNIWDTLGR